MAFFSVYKVNEDWEVEVFLYMDCRYVLESEDLLTTLQMASWCRYCHKVVAGEVVPSMHEIEEDIRRLTDPKDEFYQRFSRKIIAQELAEARLRKQWRSTRKSPPRCLACQTTDIVNISEFDFVDPVSGTNLRLLSQGHASMESEPRRRLTSEGLPIEKRDNGFSDL